MSKLVLKRLFAILLLSSFAVPVCAQYFLRGEIRSATGNPVPFATIRLSSKGSALFNSGAAGGFGIPMSKRVDTITVTLDGYQILTQVVSAATFQSLVLKETIRNERSENSSSGLMSLTKKATGTKSSTTVAYGDETYNSLAENNFVNAGDAAETSIALNINSASYSNMRRFLNMGSTVPPDGVRIEEMLNYFNLNKRYDDSAGRSFHIQSQLTTCPWNDTSRLLFVSIHAPKLNFTNTAPAKLIFLIDVSGSMDKDNRLPLVQSAFKFLVNNLRKEDTVGIVTYGGIVGIALEPTSGAEKNKIDSVISNLRADGDTPGADAIQTAYLLAERIYNSKSNNRVILATDGDFNIGATSDKELENIVSVHAQKSIYLTCLGTGMGNYKDSRLEALAKKGNGNFAYIDNMEEAQKTMVTEFTKNMYAVANNAILHVYFNPAAVKSYRLIGYDNRKDATLDSSLLEGGELGSGQSTMAVFEIEPASLKQPLATIQLRYHTPQNKTIQSIQQNASGSVIAIDSADSNLKLAAAICMIGDLLKHSKYASPANWDIAENLAKDVSQMNDGPQKEFVDLIEKAKDIYTDTPGDKKKKKPAH